jgi:amidohydrolase
MFIFQPAEEGPPPGEKGGASLMMEEDVFANPKPQAVFGMHVFPGDAGKIYYRSGGFYAAADRIEIKLKGRQTHGSRPWSGIDIVSLGADVVTAVNQIAARQLDVAESPTVITLSTVNAGVRHNIIPEDLVMTGTLRTFTPGRRQDAIDRVTRTVTKLAEAYGATADVRFSDPYPLTYNDPALSAAVKPSLVRAAGASMVDDQVPVVTGSEDFPHFTRDIPGVYVQLGGRKPGVEARTAPVNHSPYFDIDERAMEVGVRTHANLALDFLRSKAARP